MHKIKEAYAHDYNEGKWRIADKNGNLIGKDAPITEEDTRYGEAWASGCGCRITTAAARPVSEAQLGVMIYIDSPDLSDVPPYSTGHIIQTKSGPLHIVTTEKYLHATEETRKLLVQYECVGDDDDDDEEDY